MEVTKECPGAPKKVRPTKPTTRKPRTKSGKRLNFEIETKECPGVTKECPGAPKKGRKEESQVEEPSSPSYSLAVDQSVIRALEAEFYEKLTDFHMQSQNPDTASITVTLNVRWDAARVWVPLWNSTVWTLKENKFLCHIHLFKKFNY